VAQMEFAGVCKVCLMQLKPTLAEIYTCPDHPDIKPGLRQQLVVDPLDPGIKADKVITSLVLDDKRTDYWIRNCKTNLKWINRNGFLSSKDVPEAEYVILAGAGPSLAGQADVINNVKNATVVACNDAINILPNADYCIAMDYKFSEIRELHASDKTTAILDFTTDHNLTPLGWKAVRWMQRAGLNHWNKIKWFRKAAKRYGPRCAQWYDCWNVTNTALQWIANVLKPKVIIMVGCESSFDMLTGNTRFNGDQMTWADDDSPGKYCVARDVRGFPCITTPGMLKAAQYTIVLATFLRLHGISTVNATIGGILQEQIDFDEAPPEIVLPRVDLDHILETIDKPIDTPKEPFDFIPTLATEESEHDRD